MKTFNQYKMWLKEDQTTISEEMLIEEVGLIIENQVDEAAMEKLHHIGKKIVKGTGMAVRGAAAGAAKGAMAALHPMIYAHLAVLAHSLANGHTPAHHAAHAVIAAASGLSVIGGALTGIAHKAIHGDETPI